ncbi:hypothetical protein F0562_029338 [Nyssa sinensis]|uniref:C2H2-type domain-containing protein n=1 Tax=Nyssa sinensis TaxID=561372 RepID=A0A5J5B2S4_9ASTE|nr:hypothetical protein F0562_029338 [Nyssa sinensis]
MSNISCDGGNFSSGNTGGEEVHQQQQQQQQQQRLFNHFSGSTLVPSSSTTANSNNGSTSHQQQPLQARRRRNLPGTPGIKKHFYRKHGEKKWKCDKCSKKYAVQSDWKAHSKICGTKEYKCDCAAVFSRRDSFITHRAFCDALAKENNKANQFSVANTGGNIQGQIQELLSTIPVNTGSVFSHPDTKNPLKLLPHELLPLPPKHVKMAENISSSSSCLQLSASPSPAFDGFSDGRNSHQLAGTVHMSASALLQKAAQIGATASSTKMNSPLMMQKSFVTSMTPSSFNEIPQQYSSSYDRVRTQTNQSGGFSSQFMQKELQETPSSQFLIFRE